MPDVLEEQSATPWDRRRTFVPSDRQLNGGAEVQVVLEPPLEEFDQPKVAAQRISARQLLSSLDLRDLDGPKLPLLVFMLSGFVGNIAAAVEGLALPDIRADLGLSLAGIIGLSTFIQGSSQLLGLPLGYLADRVNRIRLVRFTAVFAFLGQLGKATSHHANQYIASDLAITVVGDVTSPAGTPLLLDLYPTRDRAKVIGSLTLVGVLGGFFTTVIAGQVIDHYGWRPATAGFALLSFIAGGLYFLIKEPVRGGIDRAEAGLSQEEIDTPPPPPSFAEAVRGALAIRTLRVLNIAGLFAGVGSAAVNVSVGATLSSRFALSATGRAVFGDVVAAAAIPALLIGIAFADQFVKRSPRLVVLGVVSVYFVEFICFLLLGLAPNVVAFLVPEVLIGITATLTLTASTLLTSLVVPARIRGTGLQVGTLFMFVGTSLSGVVTHYGVSNDPQQVFFLLAPAPLIAGFIGLGAVGTVAADIRAVRSAAAAEAEVKRARDAGSNKVLVCRDVEASYDGVQILFGVDLDVTAGEIVALVGTNGAGKSTLLRAVCGLHQVGNGAVFYDGREITTAPAHENARRGLVYMPGGQAVFPALTVRENLVTAVSAGPDPTAVQAGIDSVVASFPILGERLDTPAGSMSGGEQQMLALGQVLLLEPKLLMIDELSLGLAPAIVEQLLAMVRRLRAEGTTILLVEQSMNIALDLADRAVFMDRGRVQFDGPTDELLARPDLVRAIFLGGSGAVARTRARTSSAPEQDEVRLRATGIGVRFGGVQALDAVDVAFRAGRITGFVGPNGAGKTTLFDVLSGFVVADSGEVLLGAKDVTGLSPDARARLGLGRAFQSARLFAPLTVRENISVALERTAVKSPLLAMTWAPNVRRSERKIDGRVDDFVELLGLESYADRFVRELSTGTRRAVEVACQMAAEPSVLLLDEPSSGLAQAETEALGPTLLRIVRDTGCAMAIIEHDLPLLSRISDELVAMERGRVILQDATDVVLADPRVGQAYLSASDAVLNRSGSRVGTGRPGPAPGPASGPASGPAA